MNIRVNYIAEILSRLLGEPHSKEEVNISSVESYKKHILTWYNISCLQTKTHKPYCRITITTEHHINYRTHTKEENYELIAINTKDEMSETNKFTRIEEIEYANHDDIINKLKKFINM